ncbi:MAG TPA: hypothetical protein VH210_09165 [Gaiellaceae bacterium]|nr:hypothetical protein [Gaiellaceae bacterium]
MIALPPPVHPWPIGAGPRYHPIASNQAVLDGSPVGGLRCASGRRFAVHLELFARRQVVIVPPGIGVARSGCSYPLRTTTPTGVIEVMADGRFTLADFFRVWGRRFDATHVLSFRGRVSLFVAGRRRLGDPRRLVLTRHAQIVIEVGGSVAPHPSYLFPRGGP